MADLPQDFYGLTPSYTGVYVRLNSNKQEINNDWQQRIYSTGIVNNQKTNLYGFTAGSTFSQQQFDEENREQSNTFVSNSSAGISTGPNGYIDSTYFINVGDGNTISADDTTFVLGKNNSVEEANSNIGIIGGSNNETSLGITQSILINGSGKVLNESNTTVIDGEVILSTKPIDTIIHVVEAKLNSFNQYRPYQVIDGGKDEVRPLYGNSIITIVNGNKTPVYFYEKWWKKMKGIILLLIYNKILKLWHIIN